MGSSQWQSFDFDLARFSKSYSHNPFSTYYAIKKLEEQGLILLNESFFKPSNVMFTMPHEEVYRYCIANEKLEPVLKNMLRLYGGEIYTEFASIDEKDLAKMCNSSAREITRQLEFLHKNKVIVYDKIRENPQVTFLTPRKDAGNIRISQREIDERRMQTEKQLEAVISYSKSTSHCRTRLFQEYFDEQTFVNCGVCDYCITERKKHIAEIDAEELEAKMLDFVGTDWLAFDVLKSKLSPKSDFLFTDTLRLLVDKGHIVIGDHGRIKRN